MMLTSSELCERIGICKHLDETKRDQGRVNEKLVPWGSRVLSFLAFADMIIS